MPELPTVSGKELVKVLLRNGWTEKRVNGSHHILHKAGTVPISVPVHSKADLKPGTLKNLLTSAELSIEQFREMLDR
ncbi:type II toxin-antitoxin system HicA family toxin [Alicyclobacillus sp. ALC3]|uniref:type II toxin-antitoxin system HicA family toxin n=1 Tax=Alicyclobacillus sp. ALC3 TaxID=2796143 RepID=UPI002377EF7E|nr:type II toxin-antitoxin system HicA family toxin [Alicyclobacillus sp. ALC3]WDL96398.1 type II toxin-antitoxin system HicA family toxin [Alicyclobacillus sp. ALC3]